MKNIYILLLILLLGCSELFPNNENFVIRKMISYDNVYEYELVPTKGRGLIYIQSSTFYNVGDTLTFISK